MFEFNYEEFEFNNVKFYISYRPISITLEKVIKNNPNVFIGIVQNDVCIPLEKYYAVDYKDFQQIKESWLKRYNER